MKDDVIKQIQFTKSRLYQEYNNASVKIQSGYKMIVRKKS